MWNVPSDGRARFRHAHDGGRNERSVYGKHDAQDDPSRLRGDGNLWFRIRVLHCECTLLATERDTTSRRTLVIASALPYKLLSPFYGESGRERRGPRDLHH